MFSLVIERSLSLWESNICEARAPFPSLQDWWRERRQLPGITVFDASFANNERFIILEVDDFNLFRIFPNLKELDMSNLMLVGKPMATAIQSFCPLITRITWKSSRYLPFFHSENDVQGL
jgi:hypothetical protein